MIKLHHVSIRTKKLQELFQYYTTYFGVEIVHKFIAPNNFCYGYMLKFSMGGIIELLLSESSKSEFNVDSVVGLHHFCLAVEEIDNFIEKFPKEYILEPVKIGRTDFVKQIMLIDPDGNRIELHEINLV
jgi:catechol 2,3-dioxygenase-like lactoylglutathione lyase family enzyme